MRLSAFTRVRQESPGRRFFQRQALSQGAQKSLPKSRACRPALSIRRRLSAAGRLLFRSAGNARRPELGPDRGQHAALQAIPGQHQSHGWRRRPVRGVAFRSALVPARFGAGSRTRLQARLPVRPQRRADLRQVSGAAPLAESDRVGLSAPAAPCASISPFRTRTTQLAQQVSRFSRRHEFQDRR